MNAQRVLLIGGTSHVGKSTLAKGLATRSGWRCISTDSLARHPGRPWRAAPARVPPQVAEHYLALDVDALVAEVRRHYLSMWPVVEAMIATHANDFASEKLILEGSALLPECVAALGLRGVAGIWLTAPDDLLQRRIEQDSGFDDATGEQRVLVAKFLARTRVFNQQTTEAVDRLGLQRVDVANFASVESLADQCLGIFNRIFPAAR